MSESPRLVPQFRIFLSSPGDVAEERQIAREVIETVLPQRAALAGEAAFQVVDWSHPSGGVPMPAWLTPQEAINQGLGRPSACDLTIVILWGRMGTPLPEDHTKSDGSRYLSGTEWEYEDACRAKPESVYLYRRTAPPVAKQGDAEELREMATQRERLERFLAQFQNDDGSYRGGVNVYETPSDFREILTGHLERIVLARLSQGAPEPTTVQPPTPNRPPALTDTLKSAFERRKTLLIQNQDTSAIDDEIRDLKRQMREGGQLQSGDFLMHGRFELLELLGQGGFARVWRAYDEERREIVAIKVLHGQYAQDRTPRERFFRGARLMAELRHPGIVIVHEAEVFDEGYYFFVMEYVSGGDFHRAVVTHELSIEQRLAVVQAVGEALSHAHERNLIHRDIKPANILLDAEGNPKLTDFDLVRADDATTGMTRTGMMGTFFYAAPELMSRPQDAGVQADVYGLAMTTVFALYGSTLPHDVLRNVSGVIAQLDVSHTVKNGLLKGVEWDLGQRWDTVTALCEALSMPDVVEPEHPIVDPPEDFEVPAHEPGMSDASSILRVAFRDRFVNGDGEGPEMVGLPGGTFRMGYYRSREVRLSPFAVGRYPVTFEQ